jgi:uncharacterized damage-inducible protein DinB
MPMPIESHRHDLNSPTDESVGAIFVHHARETLGGALVKITHCIDQLSDDDLQWRQIESHNSIQNVILHLCGNLRQWIGYGVGGADDVRDRPNEFSDRRPIPKAELMKMLRDAVTEADETLAKLSPNRLLEQRQVQGFDSTILGVVLDSISHFVGHSHQIVFITRLRLGDAYRFQWVPEGIDEAESGK